MSNWPSKYIHTNGVQLHYYQTGGDLPTLILTHGITDNGLCWARLANYLMAYYDVIMIDARGHGYSDAPSSGYSKFDHAQDLAGLIEGLALDQPDIIGHSMGASNVASLAANFPHLVGKIILEDPPWFAETDITNQQRKERRDNWQQSMMDTQAKSVEEIMDNGRQQNPTWAEIEIEAWAISKKQFQLEAFGFIDHPFDWPDDVKRINSPSLLLTSDTELGGIVSTEIAERVKATNNNFQVDHIALAGHSIRREQFDKYVASVNSFFALPIWEVQIDLWEKLSNLQLSVVWLTVIWVARWSWRKPLSRSNGSIAILGTGRIWNGEYTCHLFSGGNGVSSPCFLLLVQLAADIW